MNTTRHHILILIYIGLILGSPTSWTGEAWHDFTDIQGRTIRGRIQDCDTSRGVVVVQREDGKRFSNPLSAFCKADQHYIREWEAERDFNNLLHIYVVPRISEKPPDDYDSRYSPWEVCYKRYVVKLDNRSHTLFANVEIEYNLFYHQGERSAGAGGTYSQGVVYGRFQIKEMEPETKQAFTTEAVQVYTHSGLTPSPLQSCSENDEVEGIWLRIHATLPTGKRVGREVCSPPDLSRAKTWRICSEPTGMKP